MKHLTKLFLFILLGVIVLVGYGGVCDSLLNNDSGSSGLIVPTDLRAILVSTNRIDVGWIGALDAAGFNVERSTNGTNFTQISTVGQQNASGYYIYSDTTVTTATMTYYYRVRAYNKNGNSDYSNTISVCLFGGLLSSFGTNGVVTSNPGPQYDAAYVIAIDSTYMYVAGSERSADGTIDRWRIEKRNLSDGTLATGFGSGGVVTDTNMTAGYPFGLAIDATYMYVAGSGGGTGWRIEKRALSNGAFDTGFGSGGVVTSTSNYSLTDIAIDSNYMYVVGAERIEKRNLSDGALITGFGTGGIITFVGNTKKITIDSTYMYVVGHYYSSNDNQWLIEKRNLSDGSLVTSFGTDGIVTTNPSSYDDEVNDITIDSSYMYVAGFDYLPGNGQQQWHIEKRNLSDGTLVTGFGTGGVVTSNPSSSDDRATTIALDSTYMYVAGFDNSSGQRWRIEKRNLSDGAPVTNFGVGGEVISNLGLLWSITIDSAYIYAVGFDKPSGGSENSQWRIEKRLK